MNTTVTRQEVVDAVLTAAIQSSTSLVKAYDALVVAYKKSSQRFSGLIRFQDEQKTVGADYNALNSATYVDHDIKRQIASMLNVFESEKVSNSPICDQMFNFAEHLLINAHMNSYEIK